MLCMICKLYLFLSGNRGGGRTWVKVAEILPAMWFMAKNLTTYPDLVRHKTIIFKAGTLSGALTRVRLGD